MKHPSIGTCAVAAEYATGIPYSEWASDDRRTVCIEARELFIWLAHEIGRASFPAICRQLGVTYSGNISDSHKRFNRMFQTSQRALDLLFRAIHWLHGRVRLPEVWIEFVMDGMRIRGGSGISPETPQGHWDAPIATESIARV